MALVLADRVLETTSVAGTGDAALGGAQTGFQPFSVIGDGSTTYYTIVGVDDNHQPTGEWEVGIGTYVSTGNYISRDTILSSSNGGAKVYFASGTKDIFLDLPSEEVLLSAGDVTGPASAVANNFAAFNMTTGKLIKDSGYNASSFATAAQGTLADTAIQPGDLGTAAYLDAGSALGVATLDAGGKVPTSQIPQMGDLNYQGTWNASTNSPTLTSSAGTKGFYYVVAVAGSTNLNGITDWKVGDWAVFNGSVWEKIDNTDAVTSVNGYTGTVVLTATDVGAAPATSGTAILYGNGSGGFSNVTIGTGISFTGGTLSSTASGGGDVTGPASATDNAITRFDTTTGKLIQNSTVTIDDSGNISGANSISTLDYAQLDTTAAASIALGKLRWNVDTATAAFGIIDGTIEVNIGQQMYAYVTNAESVTITAGQAVYLYQATGNRASVKLAYNTGDATSAKTLGLVTADITAGATGFITTQGVLGKLNTGSFAEGDTLYLGATAGSLTATKPSAPNHLVYIGVVERANNGNGQIYVKPQNGYELEELHNVAISSPANGQTILYDASTSLWKNANLTAGTGISISNGAASATITNSAPDQTVAITGAGGAVVTGTYPNFTITTPSGTVTSVTGTAPVVSSGGATPAISMAAATTSVNGYLTSTDWNTFNGKYSTGGALGTPSSGTLTNCTGYTYANLSGTVPTWNQNTTGTAANVTGIVAAVNGGTGQSSYAVGDIVYASTTTALSKLADVATGNALISGGVGVAPSYGKIGLTTHVSGTLAVGNGGTGATTLTGLVKGTGTTAMVAATAGTDYSAGTSALGTGILKSTTTTGALTIAVAADFPTLNQNTTGSSASCTGNAATATNISNSGTVTLATATESNAITITQPSYTTDKPVKLLNFDWYGNSWSFGNIRSSNTASNGLGVFYGSSNIELGRFTTSGWSGNAATATTATTANALATGNNYQVNSIGVGTAGSGTAGQIRATNSIVAYYSDERFKTNLGNITNALDKVQSLNGFYYEANELAQSYGYEVKREVGVSAQQVQAVMPEVVCPAPIDENYLTVDYERLVPLLIEAIKELKAEVDSLKGK